MDQEIPLFTELTYPEKEGLFIKDFLSLEIDNNTRIHYKVDDSLDRAGFIFYVSEFLETVYIKNKAYKSSYENPTLKVSCLFYGYVYFDGLRHLYMGDSKTDTENYLYCASTTQIAKAFIILHELEKRYCSLDQLGYEAAS